MLLFERRAGQGFNIAGIASVKVSEVRSGNRVKIAVEAPRHVQILRDEVTPNQDAAISRYAAIRIFYIEDDDGFAELLDTAFALLGVGSVTRRASAEEGLEYLAGAASTGDEPTLVLVDHHLPGRSGEAVVSGIRETEALRRLPVVMLSGADDQETIDRCFDAGANAFMRKPDDFSGMMTTLEGLLSFWTDPARRG
ncbi:MAG: response regulator [Planctomycetota bacterium]